MMLIKGLPIQTLLYDTLLKRFFFYAGALAEVITGGSIGVDAVSAFYYAAPPYIWVLLLSVMKIALCFILLSIKKSFFEQACSALLYEPVDTLKYGLAIFFILGSLSLMFFISVTGIPFTLVILIILFILAVIGEVSISINLGYYICNRFNISSGLYMYLFVGVLLLELVSNIPYLNAVAGFCVSVLSLGVVAVGLANGFIKKRFYMIPFEIKAADNIHNKNIRDIVTRGIHVTKESEEGNK